MAKNFSSNELILLSVTRALDILRIPTKAATDSD